MVSTLGDGVSAPGDVELPDVKELLHRCKARNFSSVSSRTKRLNTGTVRHQSSRSEFTLPSNLLAGLKAVGVITYLLKKVFLEAESTVLVCAFKCSIHTACYSVVVPLSMYPGTPICRTEPSLVRNTLELGSPMISRRCTSPKETGTNFRTCSEHVPRQLYF